MPFPDIELTFTPPSSLYQETQDFTKFLRNAAQKHSMRIPTALGARVSGESCAEPAPLSPHSSESERCAG